jgi:hypothetical protein
MSKGWTKTPYIGPTPIGRFFSDFKKALEMAKILYTKLPIKEAVLIVRSTYGNYGTIREEFSLRLQSEGQKPDSIAIVARVNDISIRKAS